ncbi:MAG: acetyl-CoA carboxylase biotin carboxyl carrier protein subunit [Proteobacteria bacterium]|nr:acetyl-CoA carboxylase biotin carboxyl carrier protein subunit [Pseudomonadota bacterium]MBS0550175.1 acetyl-CoA carboxylase biotin carboxyl carrier protein subunit [Pseudomonadota bacterium]
MAETIETIAPGNVWKVFVKAGDEVAEGDVLFILELMKTEVPHPAPRAGRIAAVMIAEGESVEAGDAAVSLA